MKTYTAKVLDTDDGSGDQVIQFPEEFTKEENWLPGDRIVLEVVGNSLIMRNLDWMKRENLSL